MICLFIFLLSTKLQNVSWDLSIRLISLPKGRYILKCKTRSSFIEVLYHPIVVFRATLKTRTSESVFPFPIDTAHILNQIYFSAILNKNTTVTVPFIMKCVWKMLFFFLSVMFKSNKRIAKTYKLRVLLFFEERASRKFDFVLSEISSFIKIKTRFIKFD